MTIRSAPWFAAAALAVLAIPAQAQEVYDPGLPPPLPEVTEPAEGVDALDDGYEVYEEDLGVDDGSYTDEAVLAARPTVAAFAYTPEQRAAWLVQCRAVYSQSPSPFDTCGDYLDRYEQTYLSYVEAARPNPADCEDVVEEIVEEVPPPRARARRPDKRIKLQRID